VDGHARLISCSSSEDLCYQITAASVFTEIATNHRLRMTLLNPLFWSNKLISKHICKKSRPSTCVFGPEPEEGLTCPIKAAKLTISLPRNYGLFAAFYCLFTVNDKDGNESGENV